MHPSSIWSFMQFVAVEAYWGYGSGGDPVKDVTLNIVWFVEAAMILAIVLGHCWTKTAVKPFCERCRKWLSQTDYMSFLETIGQPQEMRLVLDRIGVENNQFSNLVLNKCSCEEEGLHLLSVKNVEVELKSDGNTKTKYKAVVEDLLLHPKEYDAIKAHIEEVWEKAEVQSDDDLPIEEQVESDDGVESSSDESKPEYETQSEV